MTDEQFNTLVNILGNLGSQAYQYALRQAYLGAVGWMLFGIAVFVACYVGYRKFSVLGKSDKGSNGAEWNLASILILVAGTAIGAFNILANLIVLVNPHWRAIQLLAGLVSGG